MKITNKKSNGKSVIPKLAAMLDEGRAVPQIAIPNVTKNTIGVACCQRMGIAHHVKYELPFL